MRNVITVDFICLIVSEIARQEKTETKEKNSRTSNADVSSDIYYIFNFNSKNMKIHSAMRGESTSC